MTQKFWRLQRTTQCQFRQQAAKSAAIKDWWSFWSTSLHVLLL